MKASGSVYALKPLIKGGGGELLEVAKTNLFGLRLC
jgi:hypothetical protein